MFLTPPSQTPTNQLFFHISFLLEMSQVNLTKIRSCISLWSSMIFVIVSAHSLHLITIYKLVSMSCHHQPVYIQPLVRLCHPRQSPSIPVNFMMNSDSQYLRSFGSYSIGQCASPSVRNSPKRRSRPKSLPESLHEGPCDTPPRSKYAVPTELELNVKGLYNGKSVITGNSYSWGT